MAKNLVMTFLDASGSKTSMKINDVKDTTTEDQVKTLMDTIISKNVFFSKGGDLVKKHSAELIDTKVEKFTIA